MQFKIDENLHEDIALLLRSAGHDAQTVHDEGLRGAVDPVLADHCFQEGRALVTLDLDFADIRAFPPATTPGIIVLRVHDQSRRNTLRVMEKVIALLPREVLAGRLWIATEGAVRMRGG